MSTMAPMPLAVSIACLAFAGPAFAHAHLVSAAPAENSHAMPPPAELRLKFSEPIEPRFTKVTLRGENQKPLATGPVTLDPGDDTAIVVPLTGALPDGSYKVEWQAVSRDGHKTRGSYSFDAMQ